MFPLAFLLLAVSQVVLFDEDVRVPRSRSKAIPISVRQRPARVECRYKGTDPALRLRAVLMSSAEVDRFREGRSHRVLASSDYQPEGKVSYQVTKPGDYLLILDNRLELRPVTARVKLDLVFDDRYSFEPRFVPPRRRDAIVAVTIAMFALIAGWSGWLIRGALRNRPPA